jgi:hypothetical protein
MEQFEQIRRDHAREGLSIRALSERHGVHRRAMRQALESLLPGRGGATPRRCRSATRLSSGQPRSRSDVTPLWILGAPVANEADMRP